MLTNLLLINLLTDQQNLTNLQLITDMAEASGEDDMAEADAILFFSCALFVFTRPSNKRGILSPGVGLKVEEPSD